MRTRRLLIVAAIAACSLAAALTEASANKLSLTNKAFTVRWIPIVFIGDALAEPIRCFLTFEGSFHSSSFAKTAGLLVGHVSRASFGGCSGGGEATINQEALPWHVRYRSFTGTLPLITGVALGLVGVKLTVHDNGSGLNCVTSTTATNPWVGTVENELIAIDVFRSEESPSIPLRGTGFCEIGGSWSFGGLGIMRRLGSTTRIRLALI